MRTLDPSLPASTHLSAPNSPCLTSLLTSPSLSPPFVPRLKSSGKDLKQQSDEEREFKKGRVAVPASTGDASFSTSGPIDSMEQALSSGQCFMPPSLRGKNLCLISHDFVLPITVMKRKKTHPPERIAQPHLFSLNKIIPDCLRGAHGDKTSASSGSFGYHETSSWKTDKGDFISVQIRVKRR